MIKKGFIILGLLAALAACDSEQKQDKQTASPPPSQTAEAPADWRFPKELPTGPEGEQIAYGQTLMTQTSMYIGPQVKDTSMRFAGNNLSCKNCHLDAGKQKNAIGFVGVSHRYPTFRGRENKEADLKDRINGCMQRSLNGKPLPKDSKEMTAMVAYMDWLSSQVPQGTKKVEGMRTPDIELLTRAADPAKGKEVYTQKCQVCHQSTGLGLPLNPKDVSQGYIYPPLWGPDSFNSGAGMHRLITSAKYIKANMPFGAPNLSHEDAFDVAAYINSQPRPEKANLDKDYPKRELKPVDAPFGPYADDFPAEQHKRGPYQELIAWKKAQLAKNK